jgi:gliding motility-associated-like protein
VNLSGSGIGGTGTITISWNSGLIGANPSVSPSVTTNYTMTVTDANGCSATDEITITVLPLPSALGSPQNATGSAPLFVSFSNNSTNSTDYVWSFGNGQNANSSNPTTVSTTYTEPGLYIVSLVASNGLCSDTWEGNVLVLPIGEMTFEVPNVFSPNGDGSNDFYGIFSTNAASQEAGIYNRWGNLMVELNEPNAVWDGKVNGNEAAEGVYFMKYRIVGFNGTEKEGQTFLHLIRD